MASQPHDEEDNGFDQALHDAGIGHLATPGSASKKKLTQILRGLLSEVNKLTQPQLDTLENKLLPEESTGDKMLRSIGDLGMDRRKFLQGTAAGAATLAAGKAGLLKGAAPAAEAAAPVAEAAAAPLYHLKHTATGNTGAAYNGWLDDYSQGHTFTDDPKMAELLKKHIGNVHPSKHSEVISPKNYEIDKTPVDTDNLKLIDLDKPLADQPLDIQAIFRKEGEYFQKHLTPSELLSGRDYEGVNLNKLGYDGTIHRPFKLKHDLIQSDIDWHKARMEEGDYTGKKLETVKKKIIKW